MDIKKDNTKGESKEGLLQRFKKAYPKLSELKAKMEIYHFIEDEDGPCNLFQIHITRPFIFDVRLLPKEFDGFEVKSGFPIELPAAFNNDKPGPYTTDVFSPERYKKFAEEHIELIREKFKRPDIDVSEALDALTGDFKEYINKVEQIKKERLMVNKDHINFYNELVKKTKEAYLKSDVYKKYGDKKWGFNITATEFSKKCPLIVGFNWGTGKDWDSRYEFPGEYPLGKDLHYIYDELGSFKKVVNLFYKYFPDGNNGVQTNFCFFRSYGESQISDNDKLISYELFKELVNYLDPSIIISFSKSLFEYFSKMNRLDPNSEVGSKVIKSNAATLIVYRGKVKIGEKFIDYRNLPHPNYPLISSARTEACEYCFPF
jgi:hypothetical protein